MRTWGLCHRNLNEYETIPTESDAPDEPPIRAVSAAQFAAMYQAYASADVPHSVVFPYLHCSDPSNIAQNLFFGASTRGPYAPPYRGLTLVRAGPENASVLVSSFGADELLNGPVFCRAPQTDGISLRNFSGQAIAYALVSDVVVYAPAGATRAAVALAQRFRAAQRVARAERSTKGLGGLQYNVFVISEPFTVIERECPQLVAINFSGAAVLHIDFAERERFEIRSLSRVSEVAPGFWLGPSDVDDSHFSLVLRASEEADPPQTSYLDDITSRFAAFDAGRLRSALRVHLDVPSGLGDFEPGSLAELTEYAAGVIDICIWLSAITSTNREHPRRALVHCSDGYTESSVLALSFLMYTYNLSLADAYVYLQMRANRSFFVYPRDILLLQAIETHLSLLLPAEVRVAHRNAGPATWIATRHFDGSFPSRIFPFLYLGSIAHAANAAMLERLGITHVVSVGESALGCSAELSDAYADRRITILELNDVMDDGIDSLRSAMCECVEFIESARLANTRVLVHCRVGVSRSSTITLAYVMAHLDLNLVESYLLVRSRRLSVLIQPNLLFFWELRGWETYLERLRKGEERLNVDIGAGRRVHEPALAHLQPPPGVRPTWGYLCREIAALNARYSI